MLSLIEGYIQNITKEDIKKVAIKKDIHLSEEELNFTYDYIKNNYKSILNNPDSFDFSKYKSYYSDDNYQKIDDLIRMYINYL